MSLILSNLKDLELQELSDQESEVVLGGKKFGCAVGAVVGGAAAGAARLGPFGIGMGVLKGCGAGSKAQDSVNS